MAKIDYELKGIVLDKTKGQVWDNASGSFDDPYAYATGDDLTLNQKIVLNASLKSEYESLQSELEKYESSFDEEKSKIKTLLDRTRADRNTSQSNYDTWNAKTPCKVCASQKQAKKLALAKYYAELVKYDNLIAKMEARLKQIDALILDKQTKTQAKLSEIKKKQDELSDSINKEIATSTSPEASKLKPVDKLPDVNVVPPSSTSPSTTAVSTKTSSITSKSKKAILIVGASLILLGGVYFLIRKRA